MANSIFGISSGYALEIIQFTSHATTSTSFNAKKPLRFAQTVQKGSSLFLKEPQDRRRRNVEIQQSSIQYTGSLGWWDNQLIDQASTLTYLLYYYRNT